MAEPQKAEQTWIEQTFEPFRCRNCQKLLLKITHQPLKNGAALEIKCGCKTMNYLMGPS